MSAPGIYLDNNATTAVDERVVEAMLGPLRADYGNPSSAHQFGEQAARLLEHARGAVARLAGARSPAEIVFTSGGTESINTAFQAVLGRTPRRLALTGPPRRPQTPSPLRRIAGVALARAARLA